MAVLLMLLEKIKTLIIYEVVQQVLNAIRQELMMMAYALVAGGFIAGVLLSALVVWYRDRAK